ncbi:MAG: SDR family NAD(P)-dependent oxidoreductase [Sumerlaeia bacterium]
MAPLPLTNRVVWITGSARRVGRELALRCAAEGASVVVHYQGSKSEAQATAAQIAGLGQQVLVVQGNHSNRAEVQRMVQEIDARFGKLDVLVNNASTFPRRAFAETTEQELDDVFAANLKGPYFCSQFALPLLQKGIDPLIVNITDAMLERASPNFSAYWCAKGGLDALTRCLARELAPSIRVNAIAPGPVLEPEEQDEETRQKILNWIPAGRWGEPKFVAEALVYLIQQPFATGTTVTVDGGRRLG